MRIEDIENGKRVRVLLTERDLLDMDIKERHLTYDSPKLHDLLYKVIEFVNKETSFDAKEGQIVVEASPSDDGIIMTVWKTGKAKTLKNPPRARIKRRQKDIMYHFKSFDAMSDYLKIASKDTLLSSSLYRVKETYLLLCDKEDALLLEFADRIPPITSGKGFLSERSFLIAKGESLVKMAAGVKMLK